MVNPAPKNPPPMMVVASDVQRAGMLQSEPWMSWRKREAVRNSNVSMKQGILKTMQPRPRLN